MTIYLWSDLHLGHNKPFIYESRGFNSIQEHDEYVINCINNKVTPQDELYLLGDIILGGQENAAGWAYLANIVCSNIHIIRGNHDTDNRVKRYSDFWNAENVVYADMIKFHKRSFYLSHYPTIVANYDNSEKILGRPWNLHGHTHSKNKFEYIMNGSYNVAVDAHINGPVSIDDIWFDIKKYFNWC